MKPGFVLLSIILLSFSSCVTIYKWKYGITDPREQSPEKLTAFIKKHHYPDSNLYLFKDSLSYFQEFRNPVFRKHLFSHLIFDDKGMLLGSDTTKCQWTGYDAIRALSADSGYMKLNGLKLSDILDQVLPFGPATGNDPIPQHPDFTVVVTWAKFLGTYNSRLFDLSEAATENKTARIRMIWLNIDMQESWNLTKEQKLEIR